MDNDEITEEGFENLFKRLRMMQMEEVFNDLYSNEEWRAACLIAKTLIPMLFERLEAIEEEDDEEGETEE